MLFNPFTCFFEYVDTFCIKSKFFFSDDFLRKFTWNDDFDMGFLSFNVTIDCNISTDMFD